MFFHQLVNWKNSRQRKPLILKGTRQVGKTYILQAFGNKEYEDVAHFNFEEDPDLRGIFSSRLLPDRITQLLSIYREQQIRPGSTLIIFDGIQASQETLTSLKYFCEKASEYHILRLQGHSSG